MEDALHPGNLLPTGESDSYAQYFYDNFNPLTHQSVYVNGPEIHFICGEKDTHVPPDGAFRFKSIFQKAYPTEINKIKVTLLPNFKHLDVRDSNLWWLDCFKALTQS